MKPIRGGKRPEDYYANGRSDGGYYADGTGLRSKFGGIGADRLGLTALSPEYDHVKNLGNGLDPFSAEQLTARLRGNRLWGWDVTGSTPKGVTEAIEGGDERIQPGMWRALERAMKRVEQYAATRVRLDGRYEDRVTANLVWYAVEHGETRPVEDESLPDGHKWKVMPDPDRHIHVVIFNVTWDKEEQRWKAVKFRPIMDLRKYFSHCFDAELAAEMADLGYEVEREYRIDRKGNAKYYSWDIKGIPDSLKEKDSRRAQRVEEVAAEIVAGRKERDPYAPDELSPVEKDKLGGSTRREKLSRDDVTRAECREYWDSRRTDDERRAVAGTIRRAVLGLNPRQRSLAAEAADFSMRHHFEQESALPLEQLVVTALEQSMGQARPDDIERELQRRGVILVERDGKTLATTEGLLREEEGLAAFALGGRGTVPAVGVPEGLTRQLADGKQLNEEQFAAVTGLLGSQSRVELVLGPAGAGKSKLLKKFDEGMRRAGQSVTWLGTTSTSVKVLRKDGAEFRDTQTLARFLVDEKLQRQATRGGGRVVVDETSIMGHAEAVRLFAAAKKYNLKLIMVGDPMQHGSVGRGNLLKLLEQYGHIKPFRLTRILRQKDPAYRNVAQLLSEGKTAEGFEALDAIGGVKEMENGKDRYTHMAADYVQSLADGLTWDELLVIAPTHREAGHITQEIRQQLREAGKLGTEERELDRLVQVNATEAERGQASTFRPGDIIEFHQNARGGFVKGRRYVVSDPAAVPLSEAARFSLYRKEKIGVSVGDVLRFTGTVHRLGNGKDRVIKNGECHVVAGFTDAGNIRLGSGDVISANAGHFRHGFVDTSVGSQGRTVRRAIVGMAAAMGQAAINMQQLYVSASRAWEWVRVYTDDKADLLDAAMRDSRKLLALDLKAAADAAARAAKEKRERERLDDLSLRAYRWMLGQRQRPRPDPGHTPPSPPETPTPHGPTHAGRLAARQQQERSYGLER